MMGLVALLAALLVIVGHPVQALAKHRIAVAQVGNPRDGLAGDPGDGLDGDPDSKIRCVDFPQNG